MRMECCDFDALLRASGLTSDELLARCETSKVSYRRWRRQGRYPGAVVALLRALGRDLECHGRDWRGWGFAKGYLWPPGARRDIEGVHPGTLHAIPYLKGTIEALFQERRAWRAERAAFKAESDQVKAAMGRLRESLNAAGAAYDSLCGVVGGFARVRPDPVRRQWRAG